MSITPKGPRAEADRQDKARIEAIRARRLEIEDELHALDEEYKKIGLRQLAAVVGMEWTD